MTNAPETAGLLKTALACKCPKCGEGNLYASRWTLTVQQDCPVCGFALGENDSADGPAVLLIFVLGIVVVPLALITDAAFSPPAWVHGILWGTFLLGATLGSLRPLKSLMIALQYRHRPDDWDSEKQEQDS